MKGLLEDFVRRGFSLCGIAREFGMTRWKVIRWAKALTAELIRVKPKEIMRVVPSTPTWISKEKKPNALTYIGKSPVRVYDVMATSSFAYTTGFSAADGTPHTNAIRIVAKDFTLGSKVHEIAKKAFKPLGVTIDYGYYKRVEYRRVKCSREEAIEWFLNVYSAAYTGIFTYRNQLLQAIDTFSQKGDGLGHS